MTPLADPGRSPCRSAVIPGGMGFLLSAAAHAALLPLVGWAWLGAPAEDRHEVVEVTIELVAAPPAVEAVAPPLPAPPPPPVVPRPVAAKPRLVPSPPSVQTRAPVQAPAPAVQPVATEPSVAAAAEGPDGNVAALPPEHPPARAAETAAQPDFSVPDFSVYARRLLEQLERHKTYPPLSARRGEEGIVTLRLVLARDGTVLAAEPAGEAPRRLVEASLAAVQAASPFPPVPADFAGTTAAFTLPIAYRLK